VPKRKPNIRMATGKLWHADRWWESQPSEPMMPEMVNDDEHPLTLAWRREKISQDQYLAGLTFRVQFEKLHRTGRDSTQTLGISGGSGDSFTDQQQRAGREIGKMREVMSAKDFMIVEFFCGYGHNMTAAVLKIGHYPKDGIKYRLQEALDSLVTALDKQHIRRAA
jgi:hypothetical protein